MFKLMALIFLTSCYYAPPKPAVATYVQHGQWLDIYDEKGWFAAVKNPMDKPQHFKERW